MEYLKQKNNKNYTYSYNQESYTIDFLQKTQTNNKTHKVRQIKRTVPTVQSSDPTISSSHTSLLIPSSIPDPSALKPGCAVTDLNSSDPEFIKVKQLFDQSMTMGTNYSSIKVKKLDNHHAMYLYKQEYDFLCKLHKTKDKTAQLFHGTSTTHPKILYDGYYECFNIQYANAGLWGTGIYFACKALYSCSGYQYTKNGIKYVLVAEVIIGDACDYGTKTDRSLKQPPNLPNQKYIQYDSVKGNTGGSDVYIVYSSTRAIPLYLITYK